jgi:valyl-tRNA synthetase
MAEPKIQEKKWDKSFEQEITLKWKENKEYSVKKDSTKEFYIIDTPPPYINAPIHIGHATTYVLQDMFARFNRMLGKDVIFPLGLDRNGLPIEVAAEKKFKVKLYDLEREKALEYCQKILENTSLESIKSFQDLGCSFNSWEFETGELGEAYMTDSVKYRTLTQDTFIDIWNKNLVYFDKRINNYSPGLKTTIADSEIEYVELKSQFVNVKWKVKETNEEIVIGTTRPELIASCGMVIYNPQDDRYKHLEGKHAILPIYNKVVPIKAHTDAKIDKGTGLVMMCSAGDNTDIRFFREQNLKPIISIDINGKMNKNAGFLEGQYVKNARKAIIEELEKLNLIESIKDCMHRTPICERSKVPIEFIEMEEIYVKQIDFKDDIRKIADEMNFYDPKSKHILLDWIDEINIDWPVSRRRFYSTEIPLWHCNDCKHIVCPPQKGKYHQPWKDECPVNVCPKCGCDKWTGETRVFDTWFDSSISPFFNLKYSEDKKFFEKINQCSLRPQGKEIVRTWLYYSLLRAYHITKKPIFKDIWIHHHVVDESGCKFSKSLGNGIDPQVVIKDFGAEAFRLWAVLEGNIHEIDLRCSLERMKGHSKTLTKIWNVARFISTFEYNKEIDKEYELFEIDNWILNETDKLIKLSDECYKKYDFNNPAKSIRNFIVEIFASHYLELVKSRAYNENNIFSKKHQNAAIYTLNKVLKTMLKLWAPVLPILTYKLYNALYQENIHKKEFPIKTNITTDKINTEIIIDANSLIWKFKKDNQLSLKDSLSKAIVKKEIKEIEKDFIIAHNIKEIEYGNDYSFEK